jgi:hypothetical protein
MLAQKRPAGQVLARLVLQVLGDVIDVLHLIVEAA